MNIKTLLNKEDKRTFKAQKNILASFILKGINILISLQVVAITINYINPTRYGIWLTLSSIIGWLAYFDLGFAQGFRNKFAEAKTNKQEELAREYVSTTYATLLIIFSTIFITILICYKYINWGQILNISDTYTEELQLVFLIIACFFCINIVSSIFTTILIADQRTGMSNVIQTSGQVLAFLGIWILTHTTQGNLIYLAFVFSGIPCIFTLIVSIIFFKFSRYRCYAPSYNHINYKLISNILSLGWQFFVIMISTLLIMQIINLVLTRTLGPTAVTQYNIAFKYFNTANMVNNIILAPFWSAYTEAYTLQDWNWMKKTCHKLEKLWWIFFLGIICMLFIADWVYKIWLDNNVSIPFSLSLTMSCYTLIQILGNIYMYQINGIGKIRLQLLIFIIFAIISIPFLNWCCINYGTKGALFPPIIVCCIQTLSSRIQLHKIFNGQAKGIWNK